MKKKNLAMRAASCLAVATLLTTSIVSGTYAKYVTKGGANDTARVAKFGVEVKAEGELFSKTYYEATDNSPNGTGNLTVVSSDDAKLVAPGTNSGKGLKISVSGKPEVAVKVDISVAAGYEDVFLSEGIYTDVTTSATVPATKFKVVDKYRPIKYTLKIAGDNKVTDGTLEQVVNALNTFSSSTIYYPTATDSFDLADKIGDIELTWKWDFSNVANTEISDQDKADTVLGDLAAGKPAVQKFSDMDENATATTPVDNTDYDLDASLTINVTVTQVD